MTIPREYVATADGSLSLKEPTVNELYHNLHGAYAEAFEDYARPSFFVLDRLGFAQDLAREGGKLAVIDACFGLGYNSLVLLDYLLDQEKYKQLGLQELHICAIDTDHDLACDAVPRVLSQPCFKAIDKGIDCSLFTSLTPRSSKIGDLKISALFVNQDLRQALQQLEPTYDLVFHDPFSPRKVTELWTIEVFAEYKRLLSTWGMLFTYSAAPAVRGTLRSLGLNVYKTTAVGGKKGGTMAANKTIDAALMQESKGLIYPLSQDEEYRLSTSSALPYRNPQGNLSGEEIRNNRLLEQAEFLKKT
ncbi:MAG: hypothetical protein K2Y32_18665 [Candidatus Obscuribacterales bacterium]|nr:hypothetical protein [Candidatus Obscuribacterales bacterium]